VAALHWLIHHPELSGVVNLASPNPLPNESFMRILRETCGQRIGLPANRWMLELGAIFLQTETELILKSRRVIPGRLLKSGFEFQFPSWNVAAADLFFRWQAARKHEAVVSA
jgi:NAD dependent epimerase/dehydratase family enzyme